MLVAVSQIWAMIRAREHSDKEVGEKVMRGQDSGLILKVEPTEVSSRLDVDVRQREKSNLTSFDLE